jgi:hypothetical protein
MDVGQNEAVIVISHGGNERRCWGGIGGNCKEYQRKENGKRITQGMAARVSVIRQRIRFPFLTAMGRVPRGGTKSYKENPPPLEL